MWGKWFTALQNGIASDYPTIDARAYGHLTKPGEICYLATKEAILGRGNVHQLELSSQANTGLDIRGIKFGKAAGTKDTYSSIQYDEQHPGTLLVSNQRASFISAPFVFLEISPIQILSVAWLEQYVMVRTNMTTDDNKNLLAFRITGELPPWLFAAAIFRLSVGDTKPVSESQISPPVSA